MYEDNNLGTPEEEKGLLDSLGLIMTPAPEFNGSEVDPVSEAYDAVRSTKTGKKNLRALGTCCDAVNFEIEFNDFVKDGGKEELENLLNEKFRGLDPSIKEKGIKGALSVLKNLKDILPDKKTSSDTAVDDAEVEEESTEESAEEAKESHADESTLEKAFSKKDKKKKNKKSSKESSDAKAESEGENKDVKYIHEYGPNEIVPEDAPMQSRLWYIENGMADRIHYDISRRQLAHLGKAMGY